MDVCPKVSECSSIKIDELPIGSSVNATSVEYAAECDMGRGSSSNGEPSVALQLRLQLVQVLHEVADLVTRKFVLIGRHLARSIRD